MEIPVENSHFSTFSTEFSTGLFHTGNPKKVWMWYTAGLHNASAYRSTKFYFFRIKHFAKPS